MVKEIVKDGEAWHAAVQGVLKSWTQKWVTETINIIFMLLTCNYKLIIILYPQKVVWLGCLCVFYIHLSKWLFYINGTRLYVLFFSLLFVTQSYDMEVFPCGSFQYEHITRSPKGCLKELYNLYFQRRGFSISHILIYIWYFWIVPKNL